MLIKGVACGLGQFQKVLIPCVNEHRDFDEA